MAGAERERHPRHERLSRVLRMRGGVGGQWCVRGVCRVCGVRSEGGVGCVGAEGQWRRVDVVVVHDGTRQDQLQQAGDTIKKGNYIFVYTTNILGLAHIHSPKPQVLMFMLTLNCRFLNYFLHQTWITV